MVASQKNIPVSRKRFLKKLLYGSYLKKKKREAGERGGEGRKKERKGRREEEEREGGETSKETFPFFPYRIFLTRQKKVFYATQKLH